MSITMTDIHVRPLPTTRPTGRRARPNPPTNGQMLRPAGLLAAEHPEQPYGADEAPGKLDDEVEAVDVREFF